MDEETIAQRVVEKLFSRTQVNEGVYLMRELHKKLEALSNGGKGIDWMALSGLLLQAIVALLLAVVLAQK